jgi:cyclophilin family peptidyl-prolyl cis-trans isomerase
MLLRWGLSFVIALSTFHSFAQAQPALPDAKPTATAAPTPSATATGTAAKPAETKPVEVPPQVKAFDDVKKQWSELRDKMFALQIDYKNAKPEERKPLEEKFVALHAEGEKLQPQLLSAAAAAIAVEPKNETIGNFLAAFAQVYYTADQYETALKAADALIAADYSNKRIYSLAGKAAYNLCDFDKAEKYLKIAKDNSAIDVRADRYLENIPAYKTLWKKEQEIQAAEAKADDLPRVSLQTSKGEIVLELFENQAPQTVGNFVNLVEKGFYNGLSFHRVIGEFMAQGGDPNGDGTGGPGYEILCECYKPEKRLHFRGSLSMAHRGKDTGGSQFFITFLPAANLDGDAVDKQNKGAAHTVFGRVISGFDVLAKLQRREPSDPHASFGGKPTTPLPADKILSAKVLRKRSHAYEPTKVGPPPSAAVPTATPSATKPAPTASATPTAAASPTPSATTPK